MKLVFILMFFSICLIGQQKSHVCAGGIYPTLDVTCDEGIPPYTVEWTSPSGVVSTGLSKQLNQAGIWTFKCMDSGTTTCPSSGGTHTVILEEEPIVTINAVNACAGTPQSISASGVTAGYTYSWNFGSGSVPSTSSTAFTNVLWNTTGTKTITLTITKTFGLDVICSDPCVYEFTEEITVNGEITGTISCTP